MSALRKYCLNLMSSLTGLINRNNLVSSKNIICDTNLPSLLICGLGNLDLPNTRHSVGMKAVDYLATKLGASWTKRSDFKAHMALKTMEIDGSTSVNGNKLNIVLLKSTLPMNLNGKSILKAANYFNTKPENVYLIQDELDKPVGKFSLKEGGSARGHNGVRSVVESFQTSKICRLLIGIDRPKEKSEVAMYVLSKWMIEEKDLIESNMNASLKLLLKRVEKSFETNINGQLVGLI